MNMALVVPAPARAVLLREAAVPPVLIRYELMTPAPPDVADQTSDEDRGEHNPSDCFEVGCCPGDFRDWQNVPVSEGGEGDEAEVEKRRTGFPIRVGERERARCCKLDNRVKSSPADAEHEIGDYGAA